MPDFIAARETNRRSITEFVTLARSVAASAWNAQPVPGKWSPAQVTEHVALAYEKTRELLQNPGTQRGAPALLRPVIRFLYVRPILKTGKFPSGGKAPKQFHPVAADQPIDALCQRLEQAATGLESDLEAMQRQGKNAFTHPIFGLISLPDALQFQAFHTTHHRRQLSPRNA